jgi:uncharacterized protein (TIGR02145 family)
LKTINRIWFIPLIVLGLILILTNSCKKADDNNNSTSITDKDGNVYTSVAIGTQVWMAENLRTTTYNNGSPITYPGFDSTAWRTNTSGAYAWYDHDIVNKPMGALYNWYAVNTGKLCPTGWHVPTKADWQTLNDYLDEEARKRALAAGYDLTGLDIVVGNELAEVGNEHWCQPIEGASDLYGFAARPAGIYDWNGRLFTGMGFEVGWDCGWSCGWWSATEEDAKNAWQMLLMYPNGDLFLDDMHKHAGVSIRCIKN